MYCVQVCAIKNTLNVVTIELSLTNAEQFMGASCKTLLMHLYVLSVM